MRAFPNNSKVLSKGEGSKNSLSRATESQNYQGWRSNSSTRRQIAALTVSSGCVESMTQMRFGSDAAMAW